MTVKDVILRAYRDTLDLMGGKSFLLTLIVSPFLGFLLHFATSGRDKVMEEVHLWLVYGLAATGALWSLMFVINLNLAPFRIERDRRAFLQKELDKIPTSVTPDTKIKDIELDDDQLRKLTSLASIGAVKVWGRGEGAGIIGYPNNESAAERRNRTLDILRLCESDKKSYIRELDRDTWQKWYITGTITCNLHDDINLFDEGLNAIANNKHVGLGAAIFDLMVDRKQVQYEMEKSKI